MQSISLILSIVHLGTEFDFLLFYNCLKSLVEEKLIESLIHKQNNNDLNKNPISKSSIYVKLKKNVIIAGLYLNPRVIKQADKAQRIKRIYTPSPIELIHSNP